jgi:hypothetical protein
MRGERDCHNRRLGLCNLNSGFGFRLQQGFQLCALSGDEQFSGGRIHAGSPKLANGSVQVADLGSQPQDLQGSSLIHGDPGRP